MKRFFVVLALCGCGGAVDLPATPPPPDGGAACPAPPDAGMCRVCIGPQQPVPAAPPECILDTWEWIPCTS